VPARTKRTPKRDTSRVFNAGQHHGLAEVTQYLVRRGLRLLHNLDVIDRRFRVVARVQPMTDGTQVIVAKDQPQTSSRSQS
jgi:hypothetical protein